MNETIKPNKIFLKVKSNMLIAFYSYSLLIIIQLHSFYVYNKCFLPLPTDFNKLLSFVGRGMRERKILLFILKCSDE